jgi:predicted transcriptional regulator
MSSVKEAAQAVIERLREDATWDDLMYELYVKQKIEQGIADVEAQRVVPHDRVKAELLDSESLLVNAPT